VKVILNNPAAHEDTLKAFSVLHDDRVDCYRYRHDDDKGGEVVEVALWVVPSTATEKRLPKSTLPGNRPIQIYCL
jgi:hypothetical protein